ncbi:MAG: hypothetical protein FWE60_03690, partial [Oscillospiraceae bacterium]|nr:hypothetical protein [Oscillospiraceae bacterium]
IFRYEPGGYFDNTVTGLTAVSAGTTVSWAIDGGKSGVNFTRGSNNGFIEIPCVTVVEPKPTDWFSSTAPTVTDGDTITIHDGARGVLTVPADTTITITGTAETTSTFTSDSGIWLDIGNNSTVIWEADYTFISPEVFNDAIAIFESGTFLMTGGKIEAVGSQPYAIVVSESARAVITGGELIATGGFAVFSFDNCAAAISTAVEITGDFELGGSGVIFRYDPGGYFDNAVTGLTAVSDFTTVSWAINGGKSGVNFTRGSNNGFIEIPCVTVVEPKPTDWFNSIAPAFEDGDTITIHDGARGGLNVPAGTTVTITGTAKTTTEGIGFMPNIEAGATVIWEADYTFTSTATGAAVHLDGDGTFIMNSGKIGATNATANGLLTAGNIKAVITTGEIDGNINPIRAMNNSVVAISTAATLDSARPLLVSGNEAVIFRYDPDAVAIQGLRHGLTAVSQWTFLNWVIEGGKSGVDFVRGTNTGFIKIPCVTVHEPVAVTNVTELQAAIAGGAKHITINGGINITADTNINGNGATLWVGTISGGELFYIDDGAELTLENITLVGAGEIRGVSVNNGTLIMNDGTVIRNGNVSFGGGVLVGKDGTFIMNGGLITNNWATWGGGVYITDGGKFTLNGGIIKGNEASWGGDNVWDGNAAADAFRKALADGDEDITLTQDIIWDGQLVLNSGKTLNIDTAGYTLTLLNGELNDGAVIITDGGSLNMTGTGAVNIIKFGSGEASAGLYIRGENSSATVSNVTVICGGTNSSAFGVSAYEKAQITVTGNIKAIAERYTVGAFASDSVITVGGNITVGGGKVYNDAVHARSGAEVTIDGIITMPYNGDFIWFGPGYDDSVKRGDGAVCTVKPDYWIYTDGTSTVWVKALPCGECGFLEVVCICCEVCKKLLCVCPKPPTPCTVCDEYPCECPKPPPPCTVCGEYPCECGSGSNEPIEIPVDGDAGAKAEITLAGKILIGGVWQDADPDNLKLIINIKTDISPEEAGMFFSALLQFLKM